MAKYALVTGCSEGGIGDFLAQEFHRNGVHVFATARTLSKIQHLGALGLITIQLDVTSPKSIEKAVVEVEKVTGGKLDFLVNNAGMGRWLAYLPSRGFCTDTDNGGRKYNATSRQQSGSCSRSLRVELLLHIGCYAGLLTEHHRCKGEDHQYWIDCREDGTAIHWSVNRYSTDGYLNLC